MSLKTGTQGLNLIKNFEGCSLTAYLCPANVWTIGFGHTAGVKQGQTITQAQAEEYLKQDLATFENNVNSFDKTYSWTQNEFDAMVSFAFNIGSINQLTDNGKRAKAVIADKMLLYVNAGGVKLAGLVRRREAERTLFLNGISQPMTDKNVSTSGLKTVGDVQSWLNLEYYTGLAEDNLYGAGTKSGLIRGLQTELNKQTGAKLAVDGIFGTKTHNACISVKQGASGNITKIIQCILVCNGVSVGDMGADGLFGVKTTVAVKTFQGSKKLAQDGIVGKNTWAAMLA